MVAILKIRAGYVHGNYYTTIPSKHRPQLAQDFRWQRLAKLGLDCPVCQRAIERHCAAGKRARPQPAEHAA